MDTAIRDLERALAAGDEAIRPVLAAAYLREGRSGEALALIDAPVQPSDDLLRLEALGWERELKRLRPATRIPGTRRYGKLFGWLPGRRAVIQDSAFLEGAYDLQQREVVLERHPGTPTAVGGDALFFEHPTRDAPVLWRASEGSRDLPLEGFVRAADPTGECVVLAAHRHFRRDGAHTLQRLESDEPLLTWEGAPWTVDWERRILAWLPGRGPLHLSDLTRGKPPRTVEGIPVRRTPHLFGFLDDGRLLVGGARTLLLVDVERGAITTEVRLPWADALTGAVSLSRDGQALLALRIGIPYRIPLDGSPPRPFATPRPPKVSAACWHPRADVVAFSVGPAGTELRGPENRVVLRLPHDARPLGWTPDGHGLLVVRQTREQEGLLELWTPGGVV